MKKWKKIAAVLAAAMVLSLGTAAAAYAAEGEINVNGMGIVMADPDTAQINLSVETMGKTSEGAQKENNKIIQKVTAAMQEMGVTKENIVTTYTSVYPQYNYDDNTGKRTVTGSTANESTEAPPGGSRPTQSPHDTRPPDAWTKGGIDVLPSSKCS